MVEPAKGTRLSFRTQVDGPRFWHPMGFKTAEILERMSLEAGIPMPKLAIAWPLKRRFVTAVIIGFKSQEQPETNIEMGDWDMPDDVWNRREDPAGRGVSYLV